MISFSFGNGAFNEKNSEQIIEMVVAGKQEYSSAEDFAGEAINFLDKQVYPGEDFADEYAEFSLREKLYKDIFQNWIANMDQKIEIHFGEVMKTYRIVKDGYDPSYDEYVLETEHEYVLFLWAATT